MDEQRSLVSIPLGSRALGILIVLIERQGTFVSKHEIMDAVWPGAAVEYSNLTVQMAGLRRALDVGRGNGSCTQTVPGRGYCFLLSVDWRADAPIKPSVAIAPQPDPKQCPADQDGGYRFVLPVIRA